MTDPVAEKSGFLKMYMSNHPDTLVAYAKWYGKVQEVIKSAEMSAIDCKSMTLTCTLKEGGQKVVVVPIDPPMKGYEDVKPRLLEMKALSQEGLGMIKAPAITTFELPSGVYATLSLIGFQLYAAFFGGTSLPGSGLANFIISWIGKTPITVASWTLLIAHTLESLYTYSLCRRHSTGFIVGAKYVVATFIVGFPIFVGLRKKIQQARIDSVMKIQ